MQRRGVTPAAAGRTRPAAMLRKGPHCGDRKEAGALRPRRATLRVLEPRRERRTWGAGAWVVTHMSPVGVRVGDAVRGSGGGGMREFSGLPAQFYCERKTLQQQGYQFQK